MSSIIIFPIKSYSERVPGKNFIEVFGKKLYMHLPLTAMRSNVFNRVVIDTDSDEIKDWAKWAGIDSLSRVPSMASNDANGNTLLRHHFKTFPGYDYYWQGFVTTPLVSVKTIKRMDEQLRSVDYDSVMTVRVQRGFFWSEDGRPLNYRPELMPRSQDLPVIYQERHGLFGIKARSFEIAQTRAGIKPCFFELPDAEDADIDWPADVDVLKQKDPAKFYSLAGSHAPDRSGVFTSLEF